MQQSTACVTDASFSGDWHACTVKEVADLAAQLTQFAQWVSSYSGTLRSIEVSLTSSLGDSNALSSFEALVQGILAWGLRPVPAQQGSPAAPECSSMAGTASLPSIRLQEFTCCKHLAGPAVLSALPTATLTRLTIAVNERSQIHEALGRLSLLKRLDLKGPGNYVHLGYLSSISNLRQLSHWSLSALSSLTGLDLLPPQLKVLHLKGYYEICQPCLFPQLTQLQQLHVQIFNATTMVTLPQQLQMLNVGCFGPAVQVLNLTALQQLQHIAIRQSHDGRQDLLSLRQLSRLSSIELHYDLVEAALQAAPAWHQLQQLSALQLNMSDADMVQAAALLQHVSQLTRLTRLLLALDYQQAEPGLVAAEEVQDASHQLGRTCESLKHLTQLRELNLYLWHSELEGDGLLSLSNLTGLTSLSLSMDADIDYTKLIELLMRLTRLQALSLGHLEELYVLPVIGRMQGLTSLTLQLPTEYRQEALRYLTGLHKLQQLNGFHTCSKAALRKFWDSVQR